MHFTGLPPDMLLQAGAMLGALVVLLTAGSVGTLLYRDVLFRTALNRQVAGSVFVALGALFVLVGQVVGGSSGR